MEKMGEDAFHITKVHGENGRRCIPHSAKSMEKMGEDAFHTAKAHAENVGRCIPHNKSPWRKWEKMHST